ncbi:unnamed protein product, partial [Chrysoparadoxa australica]
PIPCGFVASRVPVRAMDPGVSGGYSFPTLKPKELLECLNDLQIPMSEEMLMHPEKNREGVVRVFERLVEATTGISREEMSQPVFAGLNVLNHAELHEDSIPELALYRACSRMMEVSCVRDFSLNDLLHPTKGRLRRHLSAVINFCKFREERMLVHNELMVQKDDLLSGLGSLQQENAALEKNLAELKEQTAEQAEVIEEVDAECRRVESDIGGLNRQQAEIRQESSELKRHANELKDRVASLAVDAQETALEKERLLGQIVNSPVRIRREMADQQQALEQERGEAMTHEKEAQRLELGIEHASNAGQEVMRAVQAVEEVEAELGKQKDAMHEVKVTQGTVQANRAKALEVEAQITSCKRQVQRFEEKLAHLRKQAKIKADRTAQGMEAMQAELFGAEKDKREGMSKLQAAEEAVRRLEHELQQVQQGGAAELEEIMLSYRRMEEVIL